MSKRRDWDRAKRHHNQIAQVNRIPLYEGKPLVDPLEPVIRAALEAKRSQRFFSMPQGITAPEKKRIWRAVFLRLATEIPPGPTPKREVDLTGVPITPLRPGPRPKAQRMREDPSKQGSTRSSRRGRQR